jgi:hypothetical protein
MTRTEQFSEEQDPSTSEPPKLKAINTDKPSLANDAISLQLWAILTQAGFVTEQHQDSDGLCTCMYIRWGGKCWAVIEAAIQKTYKNRSSFFGAWNKIFKSDKLCRVGKGFVIFLQKGDLL